MDDSALHSRLLRGEVVPCIDERDLSAVGLLKDCLKMHTLYLYLCFSFGTSILQFCCRSCLWSQLQDAPFLVSGHVPNTFGRNLRVVLLVVRSNYNKVNRFKSSKSFANNRYAAESLSPYPTCLRIGSAAETSQAIPPHPLVFHLTTFSLVFFISISLFLSLTYFLLFLRYFSLFFWSTFFLALLFLLSVCILLEKNSEFLLRIPGIARRLWMDEQPTTCTPFSTILYLKGSQLSINISKLLMCVFVLLSPFPDPDVVH